MASKKKREIQFKLTDDDYKAFGYYRIMYTEQGHRLVSRQRWSYLLGAAMLAGLFTIFHVDKKFTILMYIVAGIMAVVGIFFAHKLVLRQQDKVIEADKNNAERVHASLNKIRFGDEEFTTVTDDDIQTFKYTDIKKIDLTEEAIYVWMSDEMIMPVPLHAFGQLDDMKALYKWMKNKKG